jgi:hypothetical protein
MVVTDDRVVRCNVLLAYLHRWAFQVQGSRTSQCPRPNVAMADRLGALTSAAVAVILAVTTTKNGGDGWESNPPRTPQQRPANGFEDRGRHQPPIIPSARKMLFRQRDADALDA